MASKPVRAVGNAKAGSKHPSQSKSSVFLHPLSLSLFPTLPFPVLHIFTSDTHIGLFFALPSAALG
jgi:hypothetical protein